MNSIHLRRRVPVTGQPRRAADGPAGHVPAAGRGRGLRRRLPVGPRQPQVCNLLLINALDVLRSSVSIRGMPR